MVHWPLWQVQFEIQPFTYRISTLLAKRRISTISFTESLSPRFAFFLPIYHSNLQKPPLSRRKRIKPFHRVRNVHLLHWETDLCCMCRIHRQTYTCAYIRLARPGCIRGRRLRIHHDECYLILCHCPPRAFCSDLPFFLVLAFSRPLLVISSALVSVELLFFHWNFILILLKLYTIFICIKFYLKIFFIYS